VTAGAHRELALTGSGGPTIRGWVTGAGTPVLLAHGITAHRDLVLHGSSYLPRNGFEVASYDARAHGESDGAEPGEYTYERLAGDLEAVVQEAFSDGAQPLLVGHSMGAHTILTAALRNPNPYSGLVVIGPVSEGVRPTAEALQRWDAMADGLEQGGVEGWLEAYEAGGLNPAWRDTLLRIARDRIGRHRNPEALAQALREVPRSLPYEGLEPLADLELPALVVASSDDADPGHPYATAALIAETLPRARLISEGEGESPLAWQGGKLSREIETFAREDAGIG
jgi:pimeloyl-ACP methyl ester carboxylesterase